MCSVDLNLTQNKQIQQAARADIDAQHDRCARSNRRASGQGGDLFDADLFDLPQAMRWREWMGRVEAAIFASPAPITREALGKLVGRDCNFDELISDIREDLRARPMNSFTSRRLSVADQAALRRRHSAAGTDRRRSHFDRQSHRSSFDFCGATRASSRRLANCKAGRSAMRRDSCRRSPREAGALKRTLRVRYIIEPKKLTNETHLAPSAKPGKTRER